MKTKLLVPLFVFAFLLLGPAVSFADLVPCSGVDIVGDKAIPTCQFCHLVILINNVIAWLVGVLTIIFAIIIVVAGYRLVTSAGDTSAKTSAKSSITNAFIGFVIVLGAWLLIDLAMKSLMGGTAGPWNTIDCVAQPVSGLEYISRGLEDGATLSSNCVGTDCTAAEQACIDGGGTPTVNTTNPDQYTVSCEYPPAAYSGSCNEITDTSNPCHKDQPAMIATFGSRVEEASIICNKESGGAPVTSRSDLCCGTDGSCDGASSFSGGYFQINVLAHASKIPGCTGDFYDQNGSTLQGDCMRRNSNGTCTGWTCEITDASIYSTCMKVTSNSDLNFSIAKILFDNRGFQDWAWSADLCGVPY